MTKILKKIEDLTDLRLMQKIYYKNSNGNIYLLRVFYYIKKQQFKMKVSEQQEQEKKMKNM